MYKRSFWWFRKLELGNDDEVEAADGPVADIPAVDVIYVPDRSKNDRVSMYWFPGNCSISAPCPRSLLIPDPPKII